MLKLSIGTLALALAFSLTCQDNRVLAQGEHPVIPEHAKREADFVPAGWKIFRSASGDLNKDGRADSAFIVIKEGDTLDGTNDNPVWPRVLVVAFREPDGNLHRECVSYGAIMSGDVARNFVLSNVDISIDFGNVVVSHANSTHTTALTTKFRFQKGDFQLIGITRSFSSPRDNYSNYTDKNLNTSFVIEQSSNSDIPDKKPSSSYRYFALRSGKVKEPPTLDGTIGDTEWPGRSVWLDSKEFVSAGKANWHKADDLTAIVGSVRTTDRLYLRAHVSGKLSSAPITLKLVDEKGRVLNPIDSQSIPSTNGVSIESVYDMVSLARATTQESQRSPVVGVSVEVTAQDEHGNEPKVVLSTSAGGRKYPAQITLNRTPELPVLSEFSWEHPDD